MGVPSNDSTWTVNATGVSPGASAPTSTLTVTVAEWPISGLSSTLRIGA